MDKLIEKIESNPILAILSLVVGFIMLIIFIMVVGSRSDEYRIRRSELKLKEMELCLSTGKSYDDCRFDVYGGIRIKIDSPTKNEAIQEELK